MSLVDLAPLPSVLHQVLELDPLGYRYRFTVYTVRGPRRMGTLSGHWAAPGLVVIGPDGRHGHRRHAGGDRLGRRGVICAAGSPVNGSATADPTRTTRRRRGFEPGLDLSPGLYTELMWRIGPAVDPLPFLALHLTRVAGLTVDVTRAGLASLSASTINVVTDTLAQITLAALPPNTTVLLDGQPTGPTVAVPVGRHTVTLRTT